MIIKKPYGFLIKHFKIIHLILLIPTLYLALKFGDIGTFFESFIANGYKTLEKSVSSYISFLTYISIIFMLLSNGIIYLLMKSKKKNALLYLIGLGYYFILLICAFIFSSLMSQIDTSTLDTTIVNFITDLSLILPYPGYVLLFGYFIKGIGFNLKTMRFENNIDLHASDEDDEEIEIKINSEGYTAKRTVVHAIRELKYYVLENKFVFTCFAVLAVIAVGVVLYMNFEVYNKKYRLYQTFVLDNFTVSVKESYITNVDYSGNIINPDKYFVALKVAIENTSYESFSIDSANFRLYIGNKFVYPSYDRSARFIDIGNNYQGTPIPAGSSNDYVFVYELNKDQLKSQYQIKILNGLEVNEGKLEKAYKIINIRPVNILKQTDLGETKLGKEIILKDTSLGNTIYKLKSFEIATNYAYKTKTCENEKNCVNGQGNYTASPGNTLVIIKDEIKWDETTPYYLNSKLDFYTDFTTITFKYSSLIKDEKKKVTLKNVTPANLKDAKIYEVSNLLALQSVSDINLNIKIRNKSYTINIEK